MQRTFDNVIDRTSGRAVRKMAITCAECGKVHTMTHNSGEAHPAPEFVAKQFRRKGWVVAAKKGKPDYCGDCAQKKRASGELAAVDAEEAEELDDAPAPAPEPVERKMTREDRRIIFAAIDAVYLDADRGYKPGHADTSIASDLGVPVEWVAAIRDENFGPAVDSAAMAQEINTVLAQIASLSTEVDQIGERITRAFEAANEARKVAEDARRVVEKAALQIAEAKKDRDAIVERIAALALKMGAA